LLRAFLEMNMSWSEKISRYQQEQQRKKEENTHAEREVKLKVAQEKIPPLIEALNSLPICKLLIGIRKDEWRLGEIQTFPQEVTIDTSIRAEIQLLAKWLRGVEAYEKTEEYADAFRRTIYVPSHKIVQSELITIGAQWAYFLPDGGVWTTENLRSITNHIRYPGKLPLNRFDFATEKGFTNYLEDRERTRQYVDGIENGKIKEGIILDGVSRSLTEMCPIEIENDSFSGLRIDRADVVSQIEDWLLVVSVAKRESQRPPPYDQYKKQGEMEIKKLGL